MKINLTFVFIFSHSLISFSQTTFIDVAATKEFLPSVTRDVHGSDVAAADFDNDGDIDLYVCTARGEPPRELFKYAKENEYTLPPVNLSGTNSISAVQGYCDPRVSSNNFLCQKNK